MRISIVFQDLFFKEKRPQIEHDVGDDVIKLASKLEQGKAMHGRAALLTPLARAVSRVCARACGGSAGAVRSSRLWVGHGAAGAAGTGESAGWL